MEIIGYTWMQSETRDRYVVAEVLRDAGEVLTYRPLRGDYPSVAEAARVAVELDLVLEGV